MNEQLYITLLSIAGTIILLMISILGYFLKRIVNVLDSFDKTLRGFSEDYSATKERVVNIQSGCKENRDTINKRLNSHAKRLDAHEGDIKVLKVQVGN